MVLPGEYSKILVAFPAPDMELRRAIEDEFVRWDSARDVFVRSYELFDPERRSRSEEFFEVLAEQRIDAVLLIALSEPEETPEVAFGSPFPVPAGPEECAGPDPSLGCLPEMIVDAYLNADRPWARFSSFLHDVEQGVVVWRATAETEGQSWSESEALLRSLTRKTVRKLAEDGILREN